MRFSFTLEGIKPFSINAMYYSSNNAKTQAYYDWSFQVFSRLSNEQIQVGLSKLRDSFEIEKHGYVVRLTAYYPVDFYYRLKGGISAKTMDLSNWEKPLVDCLFLPKHHRNQPPYGSPNLNIDDRYVVSLSSKKLPADKQEPYINVSLALVDLPAPFRHSESDPHPESHKAAPDCQPGE